MWLFCILLLLHQLAARFTEDSPTAKAILHLQLGLKNDFMDNEEVIHLTTETIPAGQFLLEQSLAPVQI